MEENNVDLNQTAPTDASKDDKTDSICCKWRFKGYYTLLETYCNLWNKISTDTLCIQVCFCMLVISFYFVNCVIISCILSFRSRFTRI